jgi:hypothetical protein
MKLFMELKQKKPSLVKRSRAKRCLTLTHQAQVSSLIEPGGQQVKGLDG